MRTKRVSVIGEFKNDRRKFYSARALLVRFVIKDIGADSCHFEQTFSADGGKRCQVNWIATDTPVRSAPGA
jgi:hypothetical protein